MKDYDIGAAFEAIEHELISSMMRNTKRHKEWENEEGFNWTMWQAEQLKGLEQYRVQNHKKFGKQFDGINRSVGELIRQAREAGAMDQEIEIFEAIRNGFKGYKRAGKPIQAEFFRLNDRKLNALVKATTKDMEKAETALLRMANDKYRKIIYNAQVYANTGAGTYEKAVDMATKDLLSAGLNCIEYKNGARHTISDYASMALRTASKRAYLTGEGEKRKAWGISTVILNQRGNACLKCLPFVGKVLIDDVWSGGTAKDGTYPLLSTAIAAGLYHPNCRDSHTTFFSGMSKEPEPLTKKKVKDGVQAYKEEQQEQYQIRMGDKYDRLAEYSLDEENQKSYQVKKERWKRLHGEKNYKAEPIAGRKTDTLKGMMHGLSAGKRDVVTAQSRPKFIERIDVTDSALVESKLKEYEDLIRDAAEEHTYVILEDGKVYHFIGGKNGVNPTKLGSALKGSTMTHNHPIDSNNEYSFSSDDFDIMNEFKLKRLRGVDEKFVYELSRDSKYIDPKVATIFDIGEYDGMHERVKGIAESFGYGYWRRRHGR